MRVFSKTWKDKLDGKGTMITHTESVCVDIECQKIVDKKFAEMREKRELSEERRKSVVLSRKKVAVV